jgi:hypothetical protein
VYKDMQLPTVGRLLKDEEDDLVSSVSNSTLAWNTEENHENLNEDNLCHIGDSKWEPSE